MRRWPDASVNTTVFPGRERGFGGVVAQRSSDRSERRGVEHARRAQQPGNHDLRPIGRVVDRECDPVPPAHFANLRSRGDVEDESRFELPGDDLRSIGAERQASDVGRRERGIDVGCFVVGAVPRSIAPTPSRRVEDRDLSGEPAVGDVLAVGAERRKGDHQHLDRSHPRGLEAVQQLPGVRIEQQDGTDVPGRATRTSNHQGCNPHCTGAVGNGWPSLRCRPTATNDTLPSALAVAT